MPDFPHSGPKPLRAATDSLNNLYASVLEKQRELDELTGKRNGCQTELNNLLISYAKARQAILEHGVSGFSRDTIFSLEREEGKHIEAKCR